MSDAVRAATFDTLVFEDGEWDGPKPVGTFLTYKSKTPASSLLITLGGKVVFDGDYGLGKTITVDGNVIHLPSGQGKE